MALTILILAMLASLAATRWLVKVAPTQREPSIVPITYRPGSAPAVPRVGGVAVFVALMVALVIAALAGSRGVDMMLEHAQLYAGILAGSVLILAVGLADDLLDLSPAVKLAAQAIAATVACTGGLCLKTVALTPSLTVSLGWVGIPLTILWVVTVTNAFNFIDGLDGLASSIGIVGFGATLVSAWVLGRADVMLLSVGMIGALLGFLRYNFAPARIYLGDCGSLFVGYMLAVGSLVGATSPSSGSLIYVPVFALALPLLDAAVAIARRWLRSMPVWKGDHRHIHHRVQSLGLSKPASVGVLVLGAALLATSGLLAAFASADAFPSVAVMIAATVVTMVGYGLRRLGYYEFAALRAALRARPASVRQFIREEIRLRDAECEIRTARDMEDLRTTLDRCALAFGLDRIEISRSRPRIRRSWQGTYRDLVITPAAQRASDAWNLRVWHGEYGSPGEALVQRVGAALARATEGWLRDYGLLLAGRPSPALTEPAAHLRLRTAFRRSRLAEA
jgi:UDP-GlcNAc:undecaprenyl-phosphate GlcNAc-1-phosphate transferase